MATAAPLSVRQNHSYSSNLANTKQAQLANAYQQLARELASDQIRVVGTYTLGKVIGEGTFGSVHIASHRLTGTRCAIKKIPKSATPQLTREIHHHRRLHHPHIVHLHEIIATESHIWLVSELCSGGELFDYLVERGRILEGEARRLFGELCTAVGYLHKQGTVHRDLKLENVLLDGELKVKLGDLGFAREYSKGRMMDTFCGTTGYASPEMLGCKKYLGVETDIWSLGIILYTLLCGGLPFDHDDERVMKDLIMKGEYEEPDWLTEEARSLIRGMLKRDPAERLCMDEILNHPWFKMVLYDNVHDATSTDNPRTVPSVPQSPLPGASAESMPNKLLPSSASATSFPFSPRSARPSMSLESRPRDPESEPSETSFEFTDSMPKSTSGDTSPTTAENDEEPDPKIRDHSGEYSHTELALELAHLNSSQSTIKNMGSVGSAEGAAALRARLAKRASLEAQLEDEEGTSSQGTTSRADKRLSSSSLTVIDEHSVPLPVADHSRTPLRTKRRSLTSQIPLERRLSHQSTSSQWQTFFPEDYHGLMNAERPPLFSTPSEKALLNRLSDLGFDTGQLVHSVMHDACDTSAAMWWILRLKQMERGETDDVVQARQAAAARRRERAQRRAKQQLEKRSGSATPDVNVHVPKDAPAIDSSETASRPKTPDGASVTSTSTLHVPGSQRESLATGRSPPLSPRHERRPLSGTNADFSPSKDKDSIGRSKGRSPSMNMLQRATSVLALGVKSQHKDHTREDRLTPEPQEPTQKRGDSPTKHPKLTLPKMLKHESDSSPAGAIPYPRSSETSPSREPLATTPPQADGAEKGHKKDSFWTTFRHLFNEDRRRNKKQNIAPLAKPSVVIPTRATGMRGTGMSRTSQPSSSRRASFDGRPMYSHRSSSVNSRRSSIASNHVAAEFTINFHDVGLNSNLHRRISSRSQDGTQTPTSDRDKDSRPGSSNSFRHPISRRSSVRSSAMSDTSGRLRNGAPASPLHDYHRRSASGSASTRVRHIKVIHEAKALRPSSVASSTRSNGSSRASSFDLARDSDYDTGREDNLWNRSSSQLSERGTSQPALRGHARSRSSPLVRGLKPALRDVFQKKTDDEWESEDDDGLFAGGLGQAKSQQYGTGSNARAAAHPGASPVASRFNSTTVTHARFPRGGEDKGSSSSASGAANVGLGIASSKKTEPQSSSGGSGRDRGRRGGLPPARNQAPVIEEEEEEEE